MSVVSPYDTHSAIPSKLLSSSNQITHPTPKMFLKEVLPDAEFQRDDPELYQVGSQARRAMQRSAPHPVSGGIWRLHGAKFKLLLHSVLFLHCKVAQMSRTVRI